MKSYAIAITALEEISGGIALERMLYTEYANSDDEATGKGFKKALEKWPTSKGFRNHGVLVLEIEGK